MIVKGKQKQYIYVMPAGARKTLAVGSKGLLAEFKLDAGAVLPEHAHPHEQIGYLVSGKLILIIDGAEELLAAGDSWAIPGNARHSARALEDSLAIEVFMPVREDYVD